MLEQIFNWTVVLCLCTMIVSATLVALYTGWHTFIKKK